MGLFNKFIWEEFFILIDNINPMKYRVKNGFHRILNISRNIFSRLLTISNIFNGSKKDYSGKLSKGRERQIKIWVGIFLYKNMEKSLIFAIF